MDDRNDAPRRRASLKGKGREILLGQRVPDDESLAEEALSPVSGTEPKHGLDPSSLALTPEEAQALLDLSASLPEMDESWPLGAGQSAMARDEDAEVAVGSESVGTASDWLVNVPDPEFDGDLPDWLEVPVESLPDRLPVTGGEPPSPVVHGDAVPLAERDVRPSPVTHDAPYEPHPALEALIPPEPETWESPPAQGEVSPARGPDVLPPAEQKAFQSPSSDVAGMLPGDERGAIAGADMAAAPPAVTDEPVEPASVLVDDERLRRLSLQIEALQEDLIRHPHGHPATIEAHQRDLQQAAHMLYESRTHYEEARAIVFRIRAAMNHQRKVDADIVRYRPLLLNYYVGWVIALGMLSLLKALFAGVGEAVGVTILAAAYYPTLLGAVGAVLAGFVALDRHTTRLRDFDSNYVSGYLFNPLLGAVIGLIMFLVASIANEDLLRGAATDAERAITYLLCLVAGMNQQAILQQAGNLFGRFGRSE